MGQASLSLSLTTLLTSLVLKYKVFFSWECSWDLPLCGDRHRRKYYQIIKHVIVISRQLENIILHENTMF